MIYPHEGILLSNEKGWTVGEHSEIVEVRPPKAALFHLYDILEMILILCQQLLISSYWCLKLGEG